MDSAPTHPSKNQDTAPRSHFQSTICLSNWWLVKAENDVQGSRLAVAGFSYSEKRAMRVFSSAPIVKRYDAFTLENSDGICVILDGFINKTRTMENGFPSDIFDHFSFGFPPYWKEYDEKFLRKSETEVEPSDDKKNTTRVHKKRGRARTAPAAADNRKRKARPDEDHLSNNKTPGVKTRRKLAYETPVREREKISSASNQVPFTTFRSGASTDVRVNRSRSGRLLMPALEFWRNERAIYDVDRTVTKIQGVADPPHQKSGSGFKRGRKKKKKNA